MKIFFLAVLLLTSACTTKPPVVVYSSHWTASWQNAIMNKCKQESQLITFIIVDSKIASGYTVTEDYVVVLEKHLMDSCVSYYRITI